MSIFQRRHYRAVANTIRRSPIWTGGSEIETQHSVDQMRYLIDNFVLMFGKDNPNFKAARFRDACDSEAVQYEVTAAGKRELLRGVS